MFNTITLKKILDRKEKKNLPLSKILIQLREVLSKPI